MSVFLPSVRPDGGKAAKKTQRLRRNFPPFPSIPSPPSFSWHPRESSPVLCASSSPPSVPMAAKPQKNLTATPQFPVLSSFSRLSFFFRHSRALPGNPVPNCEEQDWIPAFGENDGGEGMARMTAGKGRVIPGVVRVFFFRHSRGIHGNPVLSCVCPSSFPRPDGGKAAKNPNGYAAISRPFVILAPLFLCPSFSGPARESSPSVGKTRTGFPPSARMTAGRGWRE